MGGACQDPLQSRLTFPIMWPIVITQSHICRRWTDVGLPCGNFPCMQIAQGAARTPSMAPKRRQRWPRFSQ